MEFRIICLGNTTAGKSVLLGNYEKEQATQEEKLPTIGVNLFSKVISTDLGDVELKIHDTPGLMQYENILSAYMRYAEAAILFFDIHQHESYKELKPWFELVEGNMKNPLIYLVATKSDLEWKNTKEELEQYAKEKHSELSITSWNDYESIKRIFEKVANDLAKKKH